MNEKKEEVDNVNKVCFTNSCSESARKSIPILCLAYVISGHMIVIDGGLTLSSKSYSISFYQVGYYYCEEPPMQFARWGQL